MRIIRTQKPSGTAVPLQIVKEHLRINGYDQENGLIETYINAAVDFIAQETWRYAQSASYTAYVDKWDSYIDKWDSYVYISDDDLVIKRNPITEITSIKYYDTNGTLQTMVDGTDYYVSLNGNFARIHFENKPSLRNQTYDNIEVAFKCGYLDYYQIDDSIIQLVNILVADFFNTRNSMTLGVNVHEVVIPNSARAIIRNITLRDFAQ